MTKLEALKELAAKIEAGGYSWLARIYAGLPEEITFDVFEGSLDAAKALHEAVLPGYVWDVNGYGHAMVWVRNDPKTLAEAYLYNPARAWLLAIIRALIAQEENNC